MFHPRHGVRQFLIAKRVNADAYMVITFRKVSWETPSTGERIVAAALFGALLSDENSNIEIACIERDTGKILWKEGLSGSIEPYHLVRRAMSSFPSAATQSKGN